MAKQWVIGAILSCQTCGKEWQDYRTARQSARKHAEGTGHRVTGEITYAVEYAARPTASTPTEGAPHG